jgi:surface protein
MLPLLAVLVACEKAVASSFAAPLHNKELSHSSRRDLQQTCASGFTYNACANCNGCKFTTKAALQGAVNGYPANQATYVKMNCWDVSSITDMSGLFYLSPLNEPIGCWNVGSVINMYAMFYKATNFNQHINNWNVGSVTDMYNIFSMLPVSTSLLGIGMSVVLLTWVACFSRLPSSTKIYVHGIISYQVLLHLLIIIITTH